MFRGWCWINLSTYGVELKRLELGLRLGLEVGLELGFCSKLMMSLRGE